MFRNHYRSKCKPHRLEPRLRSLRRIRLELAGKLKCCHGLDIVGQLAGIVRAGALNSARPRLSSDLFQIYRTCIRSHAYAAGGRLSSRSIRPLRRFLGGEDGSGSVETFSLWITVARYAVCLGTRNKRLPTKFLRMSF